jgi:hypothetical protein
MSAPDDREPLPEDWQERDLAGCWDVLIEHARERHLRGEPLHPAWWSQAAEGA